MENWIIWLPNGGFWSPQNLMRVWSRGAETNTSYQLNLKRIKLFSNFKTSYVLSENTASALNSDASLNKQLIYYSILCTNLITVPFLVSLNMELANDLRISVLKFCGWLAMTLHWPELCEFW
jgi:hypothetical protein